MKETEDGVSTPEYSSLVESHCHSSNPKLRVPVKRSPYIWRAPSPMRNRTPYHVETCSPRMKRNASVLPSHTFQVVNQFGCRYIPALMRFDTSI